MKSNRLFFVLALLSVFALQVNAQSDSLFVHLDTVGTLSTKIDGTQKFTLTKLVVSGTLNGSDILFLREMAGSDLNGRPTQGKLKKLDLLNTTIEGTGNSYYLYFTPIRRTISTNFFYGCTSLTSIVLPDDVQLISSNAFFGCTHLQDISIGSNVTVISNAAFEGCTSVTQLRINLNNQYFSSVDGVIFNKDSTELVVFPKGRGPMYTIPSTQTSISAYTFAGCTFLKKILIPSTIKTIEKYAFYGCSLLDSLRIPNSVTSIGDYAFGQCGQLDTLSLPNSIKHIGMGAFESCTNLRSIQLPNELPLISDWTFSNCTILDSIVIPFSVKSIGASSFKMCTSLRHLNIPSHVASLGDRAFESCTSLISTALSEMTTTLGIQIFKGCSKLKQVTLPSSLSYIPNECFVGCTGLTSIYLPEYLMAIGDYAFWSCAGLQYITIPNSVTKLGESVFLDCTGLTSIDLSMNIRELRGTFKNCTGLTSIILPDSLKSLGGEAFSGCSGLTSLEIPEGDTLIGDFRGNYTNSLMYSLISFSNIDTIHIPSTVKHIAPGSFKSCPALKELAVDINNANYSTIDGILYDKWGEVLHFCPYPKSAAYTIPSTVDTIGQSAFTRCLDLTSIYIPDNVLSIKSWAFSHCSNLSEVRFSEYLESIGGSAFYNCSSLKSVTIPDNTVAIKESAFSGCSELSTLTLGMYTDSFGDNAFASCTKLKAIHCRNGEVSQISNSTFSGVNKEVCMLYVPKGTQYAYAHTAGWSDFKQIVEEEIVSVNQSPKNEIFVNGSKGFISISGLQKETTVEVFTMQGLCVKLLKPNSEAIRIVMPRKGFYLVRIGADAFKVATY